MTLIKSIGYASIVILLLLAGCSHRVPQATVEVIDTSRSITPRAEKAALDAVEVQIGQMQRGDLLVLIPITGDAANDAGGRILRLAAPIQRETYDADLGRFREQAGKQFSTWKASFDLRQSRTDILGTLDAARQELAALPRETDRKLVVVSDFLEDGGTYNFASDAALVSPARARKLATRVHNQHDFTLQGVPVCLGRLESSDFAPLTAERKEAVQAFWTTYLANDDSRPELRFDGTGVLNGSDGCVTSPIRVAAN